MSNQRVVIHNVVHLRASATNNSELVSQTLMGRNVTIVRTMGAWSSVQSDDTYRGWAETRWLGEGTSKPLTLISTVFADLRESPRKDAPLMMRLPMLTGVHIRPPHSVKEEWVNATLPDGVTHGWLPAASVTPLPSIPKEMIAKIAVERGRDFRGTPYLWGGSSSFGMDCSGFVQLCYRIAGITLRRDADIQRTDERFVPVKVRAVNEAGRDLLPGDLVFFGKTIGRDGKSPDITHVGMHLTGNTFIHSAGGAGVIITEWGDDRYSSSFIDARRLDPNRAGEPVKRFEAENR